MASMQEPIRFATFNASLYRNSEGQLIEELSTQNNSQAQNVAEIIQRTNPDVLLINEFDYDADGTAAQLFRENYLSVSQNGVTPVNYPYKYVAPSNTGIASGFDLNNNGVVTTPGEPGYGDDALGFGNFPGQYGMVLYSKYPIDTDNIRTFQNFLWKDMPGALLPDDPATPEPNDWYSAEELEAFRLSSKSHWDIPIEVNGEIVHILASHPTPPVFDGPEDRNGKRNHDEIRFWADYITPGQGSYIYDDAGNFGGLAPGSRFVITGDQNADHSLVWADLEVEPTAPDVSKKTVADIEFLGDATFETGFTFNETEVGGLSGITYDPFKNVFYSISDDRSQNDPARFYTLSIDVSDGDLQDNDVTFQDVTTLLDENGEPFPELSLDPEGIALTNKSTLFISSEGDASNLTNPFVNQFSLEGRQFQELPVPEKFLPSSEGTRGIRNNLAFESLTITPNNQYLFTATENALIQDGPAADLENGSPARIIKYNLLSGQPEQEFAYITDPVAAAPVPSDQFSTNGLVDLLAIDNNGTLLALERSFSTGVGNTIKLYEAQTQGAVDVSSVDSFSGLEINPPVEKRLLLDFADLGLALDNIEGITFGPQLADGRQSLVLVSDNNFSDTQVSQILTFAVDLNTVPGVLPTVETPQVIDQDELPSDEDPGDADDPAIYVHPTNSSLSLAIATLKDGGLAVYDLNGEVLQTVLPGNPGDVRYNNVDLLYGFNLGGQSVDLAVASDRNNDTLAIFQIDPSTRQITDITADNITKSIFGVDDGERTAYGLATYTSPVSGKSFVFVSQRETGNVAQLELVNNGSGEITATRVRTLTLPIPEGGELEDAQVEGMVADQDRGYLYVGQEKVGIWKFSAEPNSSNRGVQIEAVQPGGTNLEADVEGLTIYYTGNGKGYLLASSQGDNTFAVYSREGNNQYIGSFVVGESGGIDGVQESDGADVVNVPLGSQFPSGLLVVQDGSNEPAVLVEDDGELENINSNFKLVPWENVANAFPNALESDTVSFNPRVIKGTTDNDNLIGTSGSDRINGFKGNDTFDGLSGEDLLRGGTGNDNLLGGMDRDRLFGGDGMDTLLGHQGSDLLAGGSGNDLLNGGTGNDILRGEPGRDTLNGSSGGDLFVLSAGQGVDTITDFKIDQKDQIGLAGGLTFGQLAINQGSGSNANDTVISVLGQDLAILTGIQARSLDSSNFIPA